MEQALRMPEAPNMNALSAGMAAASDPEHLSRAMRYDDAWKRANGSVVAAARILKDPYGKTLRAFASPELAVIAPDDPRVLGYAMAAADIANSRKAEGRAGEDAIRAVFERNAVNKLAQNPNDERAMGALMVVSRAEIERDITLMAARASAARVKDAPKARDDQVTR